MERSLNFGVTECLDNIGIFISNKCIVFFGLTLKRFRQWSSDRR